MYKEFDLSHSWTNHFDNFFDECSKTYHGYAYTEELNVELAKFDAVITDVSAPRILTFNTEQGYILFLLMYS